MKKKTTPKENEHLPASIEINSIEWLTPISKTSANQMAICPLIAWARKNGIRSAPTPQGKLGQDIHEKIFQIEMGLLAEAELDPQWEGTQLVLSAIRETPTPYHPDDWFERDLFSADGRFHTIIDRVTLATKPIEIIEIKTGPRHYPDPIEEAITVRCVADQCKCNQLVFHHHLPRVHKIFTAYYDLSQKTVLRWGETLNYDIDAVLDQIYENCKQPIKPNPGDHCYSLYGVPCHLLSICPAHATQMIPANTDLGPSILQLFQTKITADQASTVPSHVAIAAAQAMGIMRDAASLATSNLKTILNQSPTGNIESLDHELWLKATETVSFNDTMNFILKTMKLGIDITAIAQFLKIDPMAVSKSKNDDLIDILGDCQKKIGHRYELKLERKTNGTPLVG